MENTSETNDPLASILIGATDARMPTPEEVLARRERDEYFSRCVFSINEFPPYLPEEQNPNILIAGRWLERGGSAWWVSTAGTGKSIASVQAAYCWGAGLPFAGLNPHRAIRSWILQSEDTPTRVAIDREDIVAELREQYPDIDWAAIGQRQVIFVKPDGAVNGVAFFKQIGTLLEMARGRDVMPDLLVINPFLAYIGGPISNGEYVTPFLRGGKINGEPVEGLQPFLERFNIAALIYHHTPKPPTEKEVDNWLKSTFPEYQGAGSSDITNWGRSFVTMMKVKGHPRCVALVAGKNGSEIGWEEIGGNRRHYLHWSDGISITGGGRHAWRELTEQERSEIIGPEIDNAEHEISECMENIVAYLRENRALYKTEIEELWRGRYRRDVVVRPAISRLFAHASEYRLTVRNIVVRKGMRAYIGFAAGIAQAAKICAQENAIADSTTASNTTLDLPRPTNYRADQEADEQIDSVFEAVLGEL